MHTTKILVTVSNILFAILIIHFSRGLKWKKLDDRASIIGFFAMDLLYALNVVCIWW